MKGHLGQLVVEYESLRKSSDRFRRETRRREQEQARRIAELVNENLRLREAMSKEGDHAS